MKRINKVTSQVNKLCPPAYFYFIISVFSMVVMMIQNIIEGRNVLCLGEYKCQTDNAIFIFVSQSAYILIWTYVLDLLCKKGLGSISWIIVLFPYVLMIMLVGLFIVNSNTVGGIRSANIMGNSSGNGGIVGMSI